MSLAMYLRRELLSLCLATILVLLVAVVAWGQPNNIHVLFTGGVSAQLEPSG